MADGNTVSIGGVSIDIQAGVGTFFKELQRAETTARNTGAVMEREFDKADRAADRLATTLKRGTATLAAFGVGFGAGAILKGIADAADAMNVLKGRIQNVITANESLDAVWNDLFNTSQKNRASLQATAELYIKLRQSVKELTNAQALAVTSTFQQTLVLSGARAESAAAAILQFSQAISKGKLDGDELRTQLETNGRFALLLADNLGVTKGALTDLGQAGILTTDIITEALTKGAAQIQIEFSKVPLTIEGSLIQLKNALVNSIAGVDKDFGISGRVAQGISGLTANVDKLAEALIVLGSGAAAGAATAGLLAAGSAVGKFSQSITIALGQIGAESRGGFTALGPKQINDIRAYTDAMVDLAQAQEHLKAVENEVFAIQSTGGSDRVLNRVTAEARAAELEVERLALAARKLEPAYAQASNLIAKDLSGVSRVVNGIGIGISRLGGALLDAIGGPVGAAILAASVAMALFADNAFKAAEAQRKLSENLGLLKGLRGTIGDDTDALTAAQQRLTKAIEAGDTVAKKAAEADITALQTRIDKNRELQKTILNATAAGLQVARARDARETRSDRFDLASAVAGGAGSGALSDAANGVSQDLKKQFADFIKLRARVGFLTTPKEFDPILKASYDQAVADQKAGKDLTDQQLKVIDIFAEAAKRKQNIADQERELAEDQTPAPPKPRDDNADSGLSPAVSAFEKSVTAFRKDTDPAHAQIHSTALTAGLENLAKTDVADARKEFDKVKDLLTDQDAAKVNRALASIEIRLSGVAGKLKEFRDPAEQFAYELSQIAKAAEVAGDKSNATLDALLKFGKADRGLPGALAALSDTKVTKLLNSADLQTAHKDLAELATKQLDAFGSPQQQAAAKYAEELRKIGEARRTAIADTFANGTEHDLTQFDDAARQALVNYNNAVGITSNVLDELRGIIDENTTAAEKLAEARARLNLIEDQTQSDALRDQTLARARIKLLADEATQAGYAGDALKELNALRSTAGLDARQTREAADTIRAAAESGRRGAKPGELSNRAAVEGFQESFAQSFADTLSSAVRSGKFGDAIKETLLQKTSEALAQAFLDTGRLVAKYLFGEDSGIGQFIGQLAGGKSANATGAASALGARAAENVAIDAGTTAMGLLTAAATAATTALVAMAASQGVSTIAGAGSSIVAAGVAGVRAGGGRVTAGGRYEVNEKRQEFFTPDVNGYISPSAASYAAKAGPSEVTAGIYGGLHIDNSITIAGDVGTQQQLDQMKEQQRENEAALTRKVLGITREQKRRTESYGGR